MAQAIPTGSQTISSLASASGPQPGSVSRPLLRVVNNADLQAEQDKQAKLKADAVRGQALSDIAESNLASYIRTQFEMFKRHRNNNTAGWSDRLLSALRAFNGQYSAEKLSEIRQFGGSEIYARVIAMKCRGASSLLRDVYLSPERPWGLEPEASPKIPDNILQSIKDLVAHETQALVQAASQPPVPAPMPTQDPSQPMPAAPMPGQDPSQPPAPPMPAPPMPAPPMPSANDIRDRTVKLTTEALQAAKKNAALQAQLAEDKLDDILTEGTFYKALAEFIVDLPLFPFACLKGPVVRIVPSLTWVPSPNGPQAQTVPKAKLFWNRVSPFDLWFTPGVSDIEDAAVIEKTRLTRADLNDLLDLPGYNHDAVKEVLTMYGTGGLTDDWDTTDSERADMENRENPVWNQSGLITCLEFHGNVQGSMLLDQGIAKKLISDPVRDYFVQAWMIGKFIIKVQLSPSPRKRHPYFVTSFEKVPGTPVGNALPDILDDCQGVCNAALRAMVNNLSIASGPQVVVNMDRMANDTDAEDLYPWKRWYVKDPAMAQNTQKPIEFFQPQDNSEKLSAIYQKYSDIADDLSAIPKYLAGGGAGGAGRTASGLAMLMGNASKILQTVAANIDRDVLSGVLDGLYDMVMLTDQSNMLTGEENIRVMGVSVALQKETQRSRQLEFLGITANPVDSQILGPKGRAALLRAVANTLGLEGQDIVPSDEDIMAQQAQAQAQAAQQQQTDMQQAGGKAQASQHKSAVTGTTGPTTAIAGGAH